MSGPICHTCGEPRAPRVKLTKRGDGYLACKPCLEDEAAGRPVGSTQARRSLAVTGVVCPHCGAGKGVLCKGPGVVRFIHARRRDAALAMARKALEDGAYGN